jgi:hypothetical protein
LVASTRALKRTIVHRLLRYRRFRQIARLDADGACWVDDPDFDIDTHLRHSLLPAPGGKHELQKFVAEMASTPLNPARPRWEFNLVEIADGNSALVVRIHHAIADGIALIGVTNALTDAQIDAAPEDRLSEAPRLAPALIDPARLKATQAIEASSSGSWSLNRSATSRRACSASAASSGDNTSPCARSPAPIGDYARVGAAVAKRNRQTRADAGGQPNTLQGKAGYGQARRLVGANLTGRDQGLRASTRLLGQRHPARCVAAAHCAAI